MPALSLNAVSLSETPNPRRELLQRCAVFRGLPDTVLSELALASQPTRMERKRARTGMLRGLFVVGAGRAEPLRVAAKAPPKITMTACLS